MILSKISIYIVFVFLFCHSLRIIPNMYEMIQTYTKVSFQTRPSNSANWVSALIFGKVPNKEFQSSDKPWKLQHWLSFGTIHLLCIKHMFRLFRLTIPNKAWTFHGWSLSWIKSVLKLLIPILWNSGRAVFLENVTNTVHLLLQTWLMGTHKFQIALVYGVIHKRRWKFGWGRDQNFIEIC